MLFCFYNLVPIFVFPTLIPKNIFITQVYTFKLVFWATCNALLSRIFIISRYIYIYIYILGSICHPFWYTSTSLTQCLLERLMYYQVRCLCMCLTDQLFNKRGQNSANCYQCINHKTLKYQLNNKLIITEPILFCFTLN